MSGPNMHIRTAVAAGTIRRSRVIMGSGEYGCVEASTNLSFPPLGIALEHSRNPAGTPFDTSLQIADTNDEVPYYAAGAIGRAECGGTCTAGKLLTYDSTARVVDAGGSPPFSMHCIGKALENGAAGDVIRVEVLPR